jgi:hypothetical protein
MRTANFFEDDYGNIEIVPAENSEWCADEQRKIDEFSKAHRSGSGWSDVYVHHPVPVPLASRHILVADVREAIASEFPAFDQVTYEHRVVCEASRTSAYGPDPDVVVFVEHDNEFVRELWAMLQPSKASDVTAVVDGLEKLAVWDLILVDWGWSRVIPIADVTQLREYLLNRLSAFTAAKEQTTPKQHHWFERIKTWFSGGA